MEDKSIYNKKKTGRKTRQKGFGWYGSLNPNAGNVEKNVEKFNDAQPDGFTATNPVNGNVMGEDMEQEKPKRYPIYMWKALEDTVTGMNNIPDKHKEKFISLVGDRAIVKRIPGVGHKSALLPTSLRNKYGYTNANYNTLITRPETFNLTLEQGLTDIYDVMKNKWFKDDLNESINIPNDVEMFYDRHLRLWTLYMKDEEGNQISNTEYAPTREEALYIANNKGLFNMREALKEPNLEDLSWLDNLHDVLSSILNGQNKDKELEQKLKDAYYKNYPWDTKEWGPFNPEDTSWIDATFDAIKEYNGMDAFWTSMKDALYSDLTEATYYNQPEGSWNRDNSAELDAERKERESHKDASKRVKIIDPKDYNKYKTGTVGEVYIDRHGDEIYRVKLDDDVQDRYIPFKKEQLKFISEGLNEDFWAYQTWTRTGQRGKPVHTLTYGENIIAKYDKNDWVFTLSKDWERHIDKLIEWLDKYYPGFFLEKESPDSVSYRRFTPTRDEAIKYIKENNHKIKIIEGLEEAPETKKYSYTGPIYHLGNKIAEKSRMFTMAKSFAQAKNNFVYKAANGDIVGHYNIVDEFVKEVPKVTLDDKSTIEEKPETTKCEICGYELNPMGDCPVCDYGEDDLFESIPVDSNLDALSQLNRMEEIV